MRRKEREGEREKGIERRKEVSRMYVSMLGKERQKRRTVRGRTCPIGVRVRSE